MMITSCVTLTRTLCLVAARNRRLESGAYRRVDLKLQGHRPFDCAVGAWFDCHLTQLGSFWSISQLAGVSIAAPRSSITAYLWLLADTFAIFRRVQARQFRVAGPLPT